MTDSAATTQSALVYYARHQAALFPLHYGKKDPTESGTIVPSFLHDCSTDPAQWATWRRDHPDCNFGVVASRSGWIICDVDIPDGPNGRERAWAAWCALCASWGLPGPLAPHCQSPSGAWHIYLAVPQGVDAATLRQPNAVQGDVTVNIRVRGFTVAAGSYFDNEKNTPGKVAGPYILLTNAAPHPAPTALIEYCTKKEGGTAAGIGTRNPADVAAMLKWMTDAGIFEDDEERWYQIGMALRLEFGDNPGLDLWQITFRDATHPKGPPEPHKYMARWNSFTTEPNSNLKTLNSFMKDAHAAGWSGNIRPSADHMFAGLGAVAQLAANAGATLPKDTPGPGGAISLAGRANKMAEMYGPALEAFMVSTADEPTRPASPSHPLLPMEVSSHPLYEPLTNAIQRVLAMADSPKFNPKRVKVPLGVLYMVHEQTCESIISHLQATGANLSDNTIRSVGVGYRNKVDHALKSHHDWHMNNKGINHSNTDNVRVFLGHIDADVRFNGWLERIEISGHIWTDWTHVTDDVFAELMTCAGQSGTEFTPAEGMMWRALAAIARRNTYDPVLDLFTALEKGWDGVPRLGGWLTAACGVPADAYHAAVGANIIGGMVRRVRQPGAKHDTMAVFCGFQGSGKSTMGEALAFNKEWFTDSIMLGDESKELVLSLAGKMVCEISEMSARHGDREKIKAMLTKTHDYGRPAYGRTMKERARRNIFVGTTNDEKPLTDPTGNRRYLPVQVAQEINLAWVRTNIAQLIGEACRLEAAGHTFSLPREVWADAAIRQNDARAESSGEIRLNAWLSATEFTQNAYITAADLAMLLDIINWRGNNNERGAVMRRLGFRDERVYMGGRKASIWYRGRPCMPGNIESASVRYEVDKTDKGLPKVTPRGPTCLSS